MDKTLAKLSVVIICKDSATIIEACLRSVRFADEILVVDSGSTDATLAIARRYNARVIEQAWLGFGKQKQFAVAQAKHDWVLCIDTDERVSDALRAQIFQVLTPKVPKFLVYEMPRCNRFMGRWLRHGEGYPDCNLRLFHRRHACWSDDVVHEHVQTQLPVGRLQGDLLHESQQTLHEYADKQNRYTTLQAQHLFAQGATIKPMRMVISPLVRFAKFYLVRLGLLDGWPGLVHICLGCVNSFMKYAKLWELQRVAGKKGPAA